MPVERSPQTYRYPGLTLEPVPLEPNVSSEYFERERDKLFRHVWLRVAREEEMGAPGDYVVRDLEVLRASILLIRGDDGRIRAFHNMCKHRGNKIIKGCGSAKGFSCGFHGWTYDRSGRLVYVPDEAEFYGMNGKGSKENFNLTPIATEAWEGFVFINMEPKPAQGLHEYLAEVTEQLRGYPFGEMKKVASYECEVEANWKTFEDAFLEGYHAPFVHKRAAPDYGSYFSGKETPFGFMDYWMHERHKGFSAWTPISHELSPAETIAFKAGFAAFHSGAAGAMIWEKAPGLNRGRRADWALDLHAIFPNFWILAAHNWYFTYDFWPVNVDRTRFRIDYYGVLPGTVSAKVAAEYARVMMRDTLREDLSTIESTHATQRSGGMTHMVLSDWELMIRHHRRLIDQYVSG